MRVRLMMSSRVNQKDKSIKNSQEKLVRVQVLQRKAEAVQGGVEVLLKTHLCSRVEVLLEGIEARNKWSISVKVVKVEKESNENDNIGKETKEKIGIY